MGVACVGDHASGDVCVHPQYGTCKDCRAEEIYAERHEGKLSAPLVVPFQ